MSFVLIFNAYDKNIVIGKIIWPVKVRFLNIIRTFDLMCGTRV